jgi:polyribonucleotide nucleotidyltransferase
MLYNPIKKTIDLGDGRTIEIETGRMAKQADGAVVVKMGDTMLLAAVTCAPNAKEDVDFMPLSVEYKEKYASAGRYPGGFLKREGRLNDREILISRLIDRALRPLFPSDFHAEVFVTVMLISADKNIMPDALAGLAASAALAVSDVPFGGPISEVRVARIDGKFCLNPTFSELEQADLDIMVAATQENILMVEGEMDEISETEMLDAIKVAHDAIKVHCSVQKELEAAVGKQTKRVYCHEVNDEDLRADVAAKTYKQAYEIAVSGTAKHERAARFDAVEADYIAALPDDDTKEQKTKLVKRYFHDVVKKAMRDMILNEGKRLDGRKTADIREICIETDCLPATHGSALFTRGETQALATVTMGSKMDQKEIDDVLVQGEEQFVLHYNFPPFSTGEARPQRGTSRREIGHGNLAHRAIKRVVPLGADNPYAIRVVSDILESNGSSSMATVCAGTLALMDAGVQISKPVSGIAMGLITEGDKYAILSDILGDEDHLGDMDFKVTGTADGITATQMDIKVDGLPYEVLAQALEQARQGRLHILGKITEAMPKARPDFKPHVPRLEQIIIDAEDIGAVIGPQGKVIQELQKQTGTTITITEADNKGYVDVFSVDKAGIEAAIERIRLIVAKPEVGAVYLGKVMSIMDFGAFVEILPGKEGLLHISEIDYKRVENVEDYLHVGDEVSVKLLEFERGGKLRLSRKAVLTAPADWVEPERRPRPDRDSRDRGDRSHSFDRGDRGDRGSRDRDRGGFSRRDDHKRDDHRSDRDGSRGGFRSR